MEFHFGVVLEGRNVVFVGKGVDEDVRSQLGSFDSGVIGGRYGGIQVRVAVSVHERHHSGNSIRVIFFEVD